MPQLANYVFYYGTAKYGTSRCARYSATYGNARYEYSRYCLAFTGTLETMFQNMENFKIGEYLFTPGTCTRGLDNFKSKARDTIKKLET